MAEEKKLTGNKGEWSEVYTLLKLLGDNKVYAGDSNLKKITEIVYPILSILRNENGKDITYNIVDKKIDVILNSKVTSVLASDFLNKSNELLLEIKKQPKTFSVPSVQSFLDKIHCRSLKAKSTVKSDITIKIHDFRTGLTPILGFSIKSDLGEAPTLFNSNKSTNFSYSINNITLSPSEIDAINSMVLQRGSKTIQNVRGRLQSLINKGAIISFSDVKKNKFKNNLMMIDSNLPNILASSIYKYFTSNLSKSTELIHFLEQDNPLNFDLSLSHPFYSYKYKRFLNDVALGMLPSKIWTGEFDATGGYLIVREDGEVICYHIYNRNEFEDYLFKNTKFETPSASKHDFGYIYVENNQLYIDLNLQIRFL
ncbi:HpaII family restriction endonuclease [Sphingobacterium tabacisoli]|uniref:HpaII family restriction endonuclease n=1 Tax=Sphingobacterium tabacisoli TaxID=2044855 RepID=A0ABW5L4P3_9SPHI|nr:HpaII family restriction endonuclease [Sphingobacterium tabacisoli]